MGGPQILARCSGRWHLGLVLRKTEPGIRKASPGSHQLGGTKRKDQGRQEERQRDDRATKKSGRKRRRIVVGVSQQQQQQHDQEEKVARTTQRRATKVDRGRFWWPLCSLLGARRGVQGKINGAAGNATRGAGHRVLFVAVQFVCMGVRRGYGHGIPPVDSYLEIRYVPLRGGKSPPTQGALGRSLDHQRQVPGCSFLQNPGRFRHGR
mmetsp:Transcript_6563/g.13941  ORF Transcript_6563/g.13941 Transcript_6563/m.13941 type:complete len:208 (-) Transcript_6563:460-1083(-)